MSIPLRDKVLNKWLPEALATHVAADEEARFARLVDAVCKDSEAILDSQNPQLGQQSLHWIGHCETCAAPR